MNELTVLSDCPSTRQNPPTLVEIRPCIQVYYPSVGIQGFVSISLHEMDRLLAEEPCLVIQGWVTDQELSVKAEKNELKINPPFQLGPRIAPSIPQRRSQLMSCTEKRMSA